MESFRHAVQLISSTHCPTIRLMLFVLRKFEQNFLDIIGPKDSDTFQKMKQSIREKLIYYTTLDQYNEGFTNLVVSYCA